MAIQVFEQGFKENAGQFTNVPSVTIEKKALTEPPGPYIETDSQMEPERGTNLIAIGHKTAGSYKVDYMRFQGAKDTFRLINLWAPAIDYREGHLVEEQKITYECIQNHTSVDPTNKPPNPTFWIVRTFTLPSVYSAVTAYSKNDLVVFEGVAYKSISPIPNQGNQPDISLTQWRIIKFAPANEYSPLTRNKAQYFVNAGGGWLSAGTAASNLTAVVDHNVIIKDDKHNRTWVDIFQVDSNLLPSQVLKGGNPFDTLRVLVNGVGAGDFAGNDPRGTAFDNNIAEFVGEFGAGGAWFVFRESKTDDEVYSFREGVSWIYKPCEGLGSFVDGAGACQIGARNAGWVKGAYFLIDIPGIGKIGQFFSLRQFDCVHPVKRNTASGIIEYGNEQIMDEEGSAVSAVFANFAPNIFGTPESNHPQSYYYGLNIAFPWPRNSNGIPFGAVTVGEQIAIEAFDLLNMHQTHTKSREWFGPEVEDFYPIQGFAWMELIQDIISLGIFNPAGDYSNQLWLADRKDNKITIEYTHGHNDVTSPQDAPLAKQKVQRSIPGVASFIPGQEVEVLDIFDFRSVVRGGIENKDVFDSDGRYIPAFTILNGLTTRFFATIKLHFAIDAFRMIKPLVATNVRANGKPVRNIEPEKLIENTIISYAQLKNFVESKETVFNFEREEYPLKRNGRGDVDFGDPFYYKDPELIDESDDSLPNTRKLVADQIILSLSKPAEGPGGYIETVHGITRIWP